MTDPKYLRPDDPDFCVGHFIEECGEALAAVGKLQRWGLYSTNPVTGSPETNIEWLWRELRDLEDAIAALKPHVESRLKKP